MSESTEEECLRHIVRFMNGVSFTIEFGYGTDTARITDITGWVDDEIAVTEGTRLEIREEAHRVIDVGVQYELCSKYANRAAGGELKRNVTNAASTARQRPPHPLRSAWGSNG